MENLYYHDAILCWKLQQLFYQLPGSEGVAIAISTLGDPKICYLVAYPLACLVSQKLGAKMLCIIAWAEWLNIVLKWLLLGQRPYWWVHVSSRWPNDQAMHQVYITCETGPGNPSGHVMITGCVWWTIMSNIYIELSKTQWNESLVKGLRPLTAIFILMVLMSRVLIACHFIHQVLMGLMAAMILNIICEHYNEWLEEASFKTMSIMSICSGIGAFLIYFIWTWIGFNPSFSIPLAQKYCLNPNWVHLDSTPFLSVMRSSGSLFGLAICRLIQNYNKSPQNHNLQFTHAPITIIITVLGLCLWNSVPIGRHISHVVFYAISFVRYALLPVIVTIFVPLCTQNI